MHFINYGPRSKQAMACRPYPCGPCGVVPYPCPAPCPVPCPVPCPAPCSAPCCTGPTGPTGPAQSLSFFQAQLSATTLTVLIPTITSPLTGPWVTTTGNTDGSFSVITGAYTAPAKGVYEFNFAGSFYPATAPATTNSITFTFNVNGVAKAQTFISDVFAAGANRSFSLTSLLTLNANDVVTLTSACNVSGLVFVSAVYPAVATTLLNGRQIA